MAIDDTTVPALQAVIKDLLREVADTKRMVNRFLIRQGKPPIYADEAIDGEGAAHVSAIRTDHFYGQGLATAMREFMKMRKASNLGPATVNEIYEALVKGGFAFETENEENRKKNMRVSLSKNTALFHRLPDGSHYGLSDWYGDIKKKDDDAPKKKGKRAGKKTKAAKAAKPAKSVAAAKPASTASAAPDPGGAGGTLLDTVKAAILAMSGEFTKQEVVDWIAKNYPTLKPEDRKTSIFSMIAKLKNELKLKTAFAGKGKQPFRFKRED